MIPLSALISLLFWATSAHADWVTPRGTPQRAGGAEAELQPPFQVVWTRHFTGERLGTAMEPILGEGKLFVATHQGSLYALDAISGDPIWRFVANDAFLHSPAYGDGMVVAASVDGCLYGVRARDGALAWRLENGIGGFAASPAIYGGIVFIGSRTGDFFAVDLKSGKRLWERELGECIRQSAAIADGKVFVTTEDLRVHCLTRSTGEPLWTSEPLVGQSARGYYPVVVRAGGRTYVVIRTNPVQHMASQIAQDRHLLAEIAGVDDSHWKNVADWTKSEAARGDPELWEREQRAIIEYLGEHSESRTFFVLDATDGREAMIAPVLWASGCQGVGTPPVVMPDGRLIVLYRSAYGNWNHGVAPLVALGLLDLQRNRIAPLFHKHGMQPPWNTFWGTADESQNFLLAGDTLLIVHQGTLSGFDLRTRGLFLIAGDRDTWGGYENPPWGRNEWHGPARGGVAVVGNRLYWLTGSRVLCIASGESGDPASDQGIQGRDVPTRAAEEAQQPDMNALRRMLDAQALEFLERRWAPLYVEPGLAGREFAFDSSADVFEALAYAFPHLTDAVQQKVRTFLHEAWEAHPPYSDQNHYELDRGERRELFWVPDDLLERRHNALDPHPFGHLHIIELYAERCGAWPQVAEHWPGIRATFDGFVDTGWQLDPGRGHLFANRYLASLLAFARMAERFGDPEVARQAQGMAETHLASLKAWWQTQADDVQLPVFRDIAEWDALLGSGDALFFRVSPHRAKLALFHDLTAEVASLVSGEQRESIDRIWTAFHTLCPTWHLAGEERQVHFGENFVDPPDFSLDAFRAMLWLRGTRPERALGYLDIPYCRADLNYLMKLAILLDSVQGGQ